LGISPENVIHDVPFLKKCWLQKKLYFDVHAGILLFYDKVEMNKSPSLHMAFINFPEIFKGQKGQAQQRKRANILGNRANA